jgi:molybdopterin molybdotransferase
MLSVKNPSEALSTVLSASKEIMPAEQVPVTSALSRVLADDITAEEFVPDFDRSAVDGYAVVSSDTFGCGESMPAMLIFKGEVEIGKKPEITVTKGECVYVPTGGEIPRGADSMVMIEYATDYGDGMRYILKPSAPGAHVVYRGDDVKPGKKVLELGRQLRAQDIGALAALGHMNVPVRKKPKVGIISTGDELIGIEGKPGGAQVRDINSYALFASAESCGAEPVLYGICPDDPAALREKVKRSSSECDITLISGGSSVGVKDTTSRILEELSDSGVLFHGIAVKPGKPTIFGVIGGRPVFGLPGHPVSAFFVFNLLVRPLIRSMMGAKEQAGRKVSAVLTENIPSNHGREEYVTVRLVQRENELFAEPVHGKSGLITVLSGSDGFVRVERDCEGLPSGARVEVLLQQ